MRPSNRQRKYSWEVEEEEQQQQPRRRTPIEAPDDDLNLDDPAPRTKTASKNLPKRVGRDKVERPRRPKKAQKTARPGAFLLRVAVFLIAVGGVGYLALSGMLTLSDSPSPPPVVVTGEAVPQDDPNLQAAATPPDFGSTFKDTGDDAAPAEAGDAAPEAEAPVKASEPEPAAPKLAAAPADETAASAPSKSLDEVASLEPTPSTASPVPQSQPVDPAEVAALRKRGEEMIRQGNIGQARLFLERAMRADDPQSTLLLAQTFDPEALARWGVLNMSTNKTRAQELYKRAKELGATVPPR